jgi:hypothetical protein
MKMLILSFLMYSFGFSQLEVEHIELKKEPASGDYFPHIANYYTGEIPIQQLGDLGGIQNKLNWKVLEFSLTFPCGRDTQKILIEGNNIPNEVLLEIRKCALGDLLFITGIKAMDDAGKIVYLQSLALTPILE